MCCWTTQWSFSTKTKKSRALTPKQRTHLAYIERTASGKGSAMDRLPVALAFWFTFGAIDYLWVKPVLDGKVNQETGTQVIVPIVLKSGASTATIEVPITITLPKTEPRQLKPSGNTGATPEADSTNPQGK